jgi:hypothetical protein
MNKADVNDTLRDGGPDAVRARHDRAKPHKSNGKDTQAPRFRLIPFEQLQPSPDPAHLIKGLFPRVGLVVVWGPPKCGKSFWTSDAMMYVALGWQYRGRKVAQGPAVYCAFEGQDGYGKRAAAFRQRRLADHATAVPFYLVAARMSFVKDHAELIAAIKAQIGGTLPAAVVLDTLNRSLDGSESDDKDMGAYIRAADAVREAFGCVVIIVHHCGIEGTRPRGHTSLTGAVDAQIAVKRDAAGNIVATVEWMKDAPEGEIIASKLEPVEVGTDTDGEPITSCVVVEVPAGPAVKSAGKSAGKITPNQKRFLDILRTAILEAPADVKDTTTVSNGVQAVTRDMLKKYCVAKGWMEEAESNRARAKFSDMLNVLAGKNLIGLTNTHVWMP